MAVLRKQNLSAKQRKAPQLSDEMAQAMASRLKLDAERHRDRS